MANLTGSPLDFYVQEQINIRQKVLGNNPEIQTLDHRVLNNHNKNAWVRLASSVDITTDNAIPDIQYTIPQNSDLAAQFMLVGGITKTEIGGFTKKTIEDQQKIFSASPFTQGGVIPNQSANLSFSDAVNYSYGLGNLNYGLTPIPGLGSVSIQHMNRGAIRKFQIKIQAQNKDQLAIIEALYLRLGYYMLLEWGHTNYIDRKKAYVAKPKFYTKALQTLFAGGALDIDVENAIQDGRIESGGNYDGALFKVDNYSWSVNNDGSYDITLTGVSKGGLIDSLIIGSPREFQNTENTPTFTDYSIIDPDNDKKSSILKKLGTTMSANNKDLAKTYKETIGSYLHKGLFNTLQEAGAVQIKDPNAITSPDTLDPSDTFDSTDDDSVITILDQNKSIVNKELFDITRELKKKSWIKINKKSRYKKYKLRDELLKSEGIQDLGEALTIKFDNASKADNAAEYNYITLGALLSIIKEKVLTSNNNITVPISDGYKDNYMFTHWFQHSTDPKVCLIPFDTENNLKVEGLDVNTSNFNKILSTTFRQVEGDETPTSPYKGYLMAVHVNIEYITKTLQEAKNDRGGINLYIFLEKLMFGIQDALGGINRFTITYDDRNGINIKDDTIIPGVNDTEPDPPPTKLRLYGTRPGIEGSFLRNVSAQSKITGKMATQIAIGSTASGNSINESTSLLARWNSGMVDRIQAAEPNVKETTDAEPNTLLEEVNKQYETQLKFLQDSYQNFKYLGNPSYSSAQTTLKNLLDYDLAVKTVNGNIGGKGFIPIDLTLEMDGLSGILLYQKIQTTEEILPSSYVNKVDFIVMGLDHTIDGNEWTTTVSTLSTPKKTNLAKNASSKDDTEFSLLNPPNPETGQSEPKPKKKNSAQTNPQSGWMPAEAANELNN
jgi:hypothetical protein